MADTTSRDYDWAALVRANEGPEFNDRPVEYEFSNGRQFKAALIPYQSAVPEAPAE